MIRIHLMGSPHWNQSKLTTRANNLSIAICTSGIKVMKEKVWFAWSFNSQSRQHVTFYCNINMRQMYCENSNSVAQIRRASLSFNKYGARKEIKSRVGLFPSGYNFMYCLCWFETSHFHLFTRMVKSSQFKIIYDGRLSFNERLRCKFHRGLSVATDRRSFIHYAYQQCFHRSRCNKYNYQRYRHSC